MSPGLYDSPPPSVSRIIEQEQALLPRDNDSENITRLSNPNKTASQSFTTFTSILEDRKLVAVSSTTLHRSLYIPAFVLGYTALAIFAWAVICILSHKPITTGHYGVSLRNYDADDIEVDIHWLFVKNEQWFRAARVIQSVVTVLTIPLTSAVCSKAAIVFVQRQSGLSLRQTMTLADKGWTDPKLYPKLLFGGLKRYGSSFLFLAILLNILGGIISPLQSLFLTSQTIKTPTWPTGTLRQLTDIGLDPPNSESDLVPVMVRSAITSASTTDLQNGLWTSSPIICSTASNETDTPCTLGGITLANMSSLPNPFLAQLPSGYNTGLIRQFLPRINSSATREVITEAEFPENCDTLPGSFYVNYANAVEVGNWSLIACMPANQTLSPWKAVRTRQDFSEELYLNLSAFFPNVISPDKAQGGFFKITVNTTAGFFELPNYMNRQLPGPLLDDDPSNHCGLNCVSQGIQTNSIHDHNLTSRGSLTRRDNINGTNIISNSSLGLEMSTAKGPLLNIAIALFGEGSFISDRLTHPDAYINTNITLDTECIDQAPLIGLLHSSSGEPQSDNSRIDPCITKNVDDVSLQEQIAMYVSSLYFNSGDGYMDGDGYGYGGERIKNAFESAAFLANEAWLQSSNAHSLMVNYNLGADTVVPTISRAGIFLISVLLAVDLLSLLAMALYSAWIPCWTDQLDAFAMMRIGAAIAESIPFRVADTTDRIQVLDETPGWVGDATGGKGEVGELGIGAPTPLRGRRKYVCY